MTDRQQSASAEDSLIARYFKPLATDPGAFGLVDDAAILKASGEDIVVKTDAIVEGVHFLPDDPPDTIARKALRVNLSDLASKGATPAGFVLTLALRNARGGTRPDPVRAALAAIAAGADGITAHLREDRRHIRDDDMARLKAEISRPLNFEMAATPDMLGIALATRPHAVCLVPERR